MREELGLPWLQPDMFRIGASGLLTDIERQLDHFRDRALFSRLSPRNGVRFFLWASSRTSCARWTMVPRPKAASPSEPGSERQGGFGHFINGAFSKPGELFDVFNPATGDRIARVTQGAPKDIDAAVAAARKALPKWAALSGFERSKHLYALARHVQKRERFLSVLETIDNGKPIRESRDIDVPLVARHFYHHAGWASLIDQRVLQGRSPPACAGRSSVKIPAADARLEGRGRASGRLYLRAEAGGGDAAHRALARRALLESAFRRASSTSSPAMGRPAARSLACRRRQDRLHRLDRSRPRRSARRRRPGGAFARTRRRVAIRPVRGRGSRAGGCRAWSTRSGSTRARSARPARGSFVAEASPEALCASCGARMANREWATRSTSRPAFGAIVAPVQARSGSAAHRGKASGGAHSSPPTIRLPASGLLSATLVTGRTLRRYGGAGGDLRPRSGGADLRRRRTKRSRSPTIPVMASRPPSGPRMSIARCVGHGRSGWRRLDPSTNMSTPAWASAATAKAVSAAKGDEEGSGSVRAVEGTNSKPCPKAPALNASPGGSRARTMQSRRSTRTPRCSRRQASRPDSGYSYTVLDPAGRRGRTCPASATARISATPSKRRRRRPPWGAATAHNRTQVLYYLAENLATAGRRVARRLSAMTGASARAAKAEVEARFAARSLCRGYADEFDSVVTPHARALSLWR